jgi:hypothetical protein
MSSKYQNVKKILYPPRTSVGAFGTWLAFTIGCCMLFISISICLSLRVLFQKSNNIDTNNYVIINKSIDESTMVNPSQKIFTQNEIDNLLQAPQVNNAAILLPAQFQAAAQLRLGSQSFYSLLFIEAAPSSFLDVPMPQWDSSSKIIPIIMSKEFLRMYNFILAPTQGLPTLTEQTIKALSFNIQISRNQNLENYQGEIVGFTDRFNTILAPSEFIEYGNRHFDIAAPIGPTRIIAQIKNIQDPSFIQFLKLNRLEINAETTRLDKIAHVIDIISIALAVLATIILALSCILIHQFIQMKITTSRHKIRLLYELGYNSKLILNIFIKKSVIALITIILLSLLLTQLFQYFFVHQLNALQLAISPSMPILVYCLAMLLLFGVVGLFYQATLKQLNKI